MYTSTDDDDPKQSKLEEKYLEIAALMLGTPKCFELLVHDHLACNLLTEESLSEAANKPDKWAPTLQQWVPGLRELLVEYLEILEAA
jgi:hypothetical protein